MSWHVDPSVLGSPPSLDAAAADGELRGFASDQAQDADARRTWDWESPGVRPTPRIEETMTRYCVVELTGETSPTHVGDILRALHAVRGVRLAKPYPYMGEVSVKASSTHPPPFETLAAALETVGFSLRAHGRPC